MMLLNRISVVILASVISWPFAIGQESAYVDLQGALVQSTLQPEPLMLSRFPSTFSIATTRQLSNLSTVDMSGNVWQWPLSSPPGPVMITSTKSEPTCAVLSSDGDFLAFADSDASVTLMHLDSQQTKFRDESQLANTAVLRFSKDDQLLAGVTNDGKVRVWNVMSGDVICEFQTEPGAMQALAFSPAGNTLAVASYSSELRLFNFASSGGSAEPRTIAIGDSRITAISFTPDGQQIVIAAADGTIVIQRLASIDQQISLDSHPFATWSIAFDKTGQRMVAGSWDGTTRIWDTNSWQLIQKMKGHEESVSSMIFAESGMVSAGMDGRLLFWKSQAPGIKPRGIITGPAAPVWACRYSPDGKQLFIGGSGQRSELWDVDKNETLISIKGNSTTRCAAFSPDSRILATGSDDRTILLTATETGKIHHTLKGHRGQISAVLFVDDGRTLISGCDAGELKFWDAATGTELATHRRHTQQLYGAAVSANQKWLVTGGGNWQKGDPGELIVWDVQQRQFKASLPGHRLTVWSIVFTPDGKQFATSDSAGDVIVWNTETLQQVRTLKHETWLRPLAMSPDGQMLAVGQGNGSIRLWDTTTWTKRGECIGHDSFTFWLEFSPDGQTLASGGNDGTVRFWRAPSQ